MADLFYYRIDFTFTTCRTCSLLTELSFISICVMPNEQNLAPGTTIRDSGFPMKSFDVCVLAWSIHPINPIQPQLMPSARIQ